MSDEIDQLKNLRLRKVAELFDDEVQEGALAWRIRRAMLRVGHIWRAAVGHFWRAFRDMVRRRRTARPSVRGDTGAARWTHPVRRRATN